MEVKQVGSNKNGIPVFSYRKPEPTTVEMFDGLDSEGRPKFKPILVICVRN